MMKSNLKSIILDFLGLLFFAEKNEFLFAFTLRPLHMHKLDNQHESSEDTSGLRIEQLTVGLHVH
jgi:hypothetical protein